MSMSYERWQWLRGQEKYHARRMRKRVVRGDWHRQQRNWFRRQLRQATYAELVSYVFRSRAKQIAANVCANNTLFAYLTSKA